MDLLLVRHGEPDYSDVDKRGYAGHGRDLAKLTEKGVQQAEQAAGDKRLPGADLILSSPYTRALQTASVISRVTGIPLTVETDLHEWMPDLTFTYTGPEEIPAILKEMERYEGEWCKTTAPKLRRIWFTMKCNETHGCMDRRGMETVK